MKNVYVNLFTLIITAALVSFSSFSISLPMREGRINFEEVVIAKSVKGEQQLTSALEKWVQTKARDWKLTISPSKENRSIFIIKGLVRIDPETGDYRAVDASFQLSVHLIDDRYRYELTDIYFIKAGQQFDATEVYKGVIKGDPFMRPKTEKKSAVLERHEELLDKLNKKIALIIQSLKQGL